MKQSMRRQWTGEGDDSAHKEGEKKMRQTKFALRANRQNEMIQLMKKEQCGDDSEVIWGSNRGK